MLHYHVVVVTPFAQNCSILWDDANNGAVVIDPGGDLELVMNELTMRNLRLEQIWITHAHIDHAGGAKELSDILHAPIIGPHPDDQFWIDSLSQQSQHYGLTSSATFVPSQWLYDQDIITFGEHRITVRHCPGHTPGHVVFYVSTLKCAFVGDVLFFGSIGRTDFPRGNYEQLINSIKERLLPIGDETIFIPGHGHSSTFGYERVHNPFLGSV